MSLFLYTTMSCLLAGCMSAAHREVLPGPKTRIDCSQSALKAIGNPIILSEQRTDPCRPSPIAHEQEQKEKNHIALWAAILYQKFHPLWIPYKVRYLIAEYMDKPRTWKCTAETRIPQSTGCAYIPSSAAGPLLAVGNAETHDIQILKSNDGKMVSNLQGHTSMIRSLIYSRLNSILISASHDKTIRLWKIPEKSVHQAKHLSTLHHLAYSMILSPNEESFALDMSYYIAMKQISEVGVVSLPKGKLITTFSFEDDYHIATMSWHHDGNILLVHGYLGANVMIYGAQTIMLDVPRKAPLRVFRYNSEDVYATIWPTALVYLSHHDHIYFVNTRRHNNLSIVSATNGKQAKTLQDWSDLPRPTCKIIASPQNGFVASIATCNTGLVLLDTTANKAYKPLHGKEKGCNWYGDMFFVSEDHFIFINRTQIYPNYATAHFVRYVPS